MRPDAEHVTEAVFDQLLRLYADTSSVAVCLTAIAVMRGCQRALAMAYSDEISGQSMEDWISDALATDPTLLNAQMH